MADSLQIGLALATSGKQLDPASAMAIGKNIPKTANAKDLMSIASSIPLQCFNNTLPSDLVNNLAQMDLGNMDSFRKTFIADKVRDLIKKIKYLK